MSAPAPANRRSASASRRFNPLKALQPERRLQQMLASSSSAPIPVPTAASGTLPVPTGASGTILVPTAASGTIPVPTGALGRMQAASPAAMENSTAVLPAFDYCRFIELDYVPMETGCMVSMRPTKSYAATKSPTKSYASSNKSPTKGYASSNKSPTKGYASTRSPERHISRSTSHSPSTPSRSRRSAAAALGSRDPTGNTSLSSSSNSGSCKGSECSPTKGRHQKYTSCTDNHGIRPPPPEQYLTPLQQKEVCIRHLRARLKDTVDRLQDRDTEIGELRGQLTRMQEDWVEEECHRVEAQLALKEARREIQQLKNAVDTVRSSLMSEGAGPGGGLSADEGVQKYFQDINVQNHKLENLLLSMELHAQTGLAKDGFGEAGGVGGPPPPGFGRLRGGGSAPASVSGESPSGATPSRPAFGGRAGSCSCDCSPARSLTRSSTYTKLSDQALADIGVPHGGGLSGGDSGTTQDSGFVCCGGGGGGGGFVPSRADLLLEAAFLSEETANLLSCCGVQTLPLSRGYGAQTLPHSLPGSLSHSHTYSHTLPHAARPGGHNNPSSHTSLPHSSTYETLGATTTAPFHCCPLQGGGGGGGVAGSASHPCLSHHHLYLHHLRETGIQTESVPAPSDLDTIAEQRTFRSQACSPTSTWLSDEGEEELDSITTTTTTGSTCTATVRSTATEPLPVSKRPRQASASMPRSATMSGSMEAPSRRGGRKGGGGGEEEEGEEEWEDEEEEEEMEEKQESEEREKDDVEWQRGMSDAGSAAEGLSEISENMEDVCSETADREQEQVDRPAGGMGGDSEEDGEQETAPGEPQGETTAGGGQQGELEASERTTEEEEERQAEIKPEDPSEEGGREGGGRKEEGREGGRHRQASARTETPESSKATSPGSSSAGVEQPHTSQPRRSASHEDMAAGGVGTSVDEDEDDTNEEAVVVGRRGGGGGGVASEDGGDGDAGPVERSYWSRHFLVDLLAVAVPVVPTVAWLCRGPVRAGQPMYHIGSLLRGCCTVALCSLRRGGGLRHYPAGGGDLGGTNI